MWATAGIKPAELSGLEPEREKRYKDVFEAWEKSDCMLFTGYDKWFFTAICQSEIRLEFLSTVGTGHQHTTDILRETQFLSTFFALLNSVFMHGLRELNFYPILWFVLQYKIITPHKGV